MEKQSLLLKLNEKYPHCVLKTSFFGLSNTEILWLDVGFFLSVVELLKKDSDLNLDWLENFSVIHFENKLILSYFIRSRITQFDLILRLTLSVYDPYSRITLPSVKKFWPMADFFEQEAEKMFGLLFQEQTELSKNKQSVSFYDPGEGFPLRKDYQFPQTVQGVAHASRLRAIRKSL